MDTVTKIIANPAIVWTIIVGIVGLLAVGLGLFWLFSKRFRLNRLSELRGKLDDLKPSDPEYGAVRALYTSMLIDASRWGFFHSDASSGTGTASSDHSVAGHSGDGASDGGQY